MNLAGLKEIYARRARAMARRPRFGRGVDRARVSLGEGFACQIEHPDRVLCADQPPENGGSGIGPSPGQLMRASLGASLAMGYRLWGVRLDVLIAAVEVDVECSFDARGQLGVAADVAVGWEAITFDVTITGGPGTAADAIRQVVETADRLNPILANLSPSIRRTHRLTVVTPAEAHPRRGAAEKL